MYFDIFETGPVWAAEYSRNIHFTLGKRQQTVALSTTEQSLWRLKLSRMRTSHIIKCVRNIMCASTNKYTDFSITLTLEMF